MSSCLSSSFLELMPTLFAPSSLPEDMCSPDSNSPAISSKWPHWSHTGIFRDFIRVKNESELVLNIHLTVSGSGKDKKLMALPMLKSLCNWSASSMTMTAGLDALMPS